MTPVSLTERPWQQIDAATLARAAHVPTMLGPEVQQLYYWLAREAVGGEGAIADLGSFVGGSAARLVLGMIDGGRRGRVHLFDRFTADERVKARLLYPAGIPVFEGEDALHVAKALLAPFADRLRFHRGDVVTKTWPENAGPIALMTLDICKLPGVSDIVAQRFLPHLRKGAVIVQKDFAAWDQPWTCAQTLLLTDWLEPLVRVEDSLVLRCERVPTAEGLRGATIEDLDDATLIAALRQAQRAFADQEVEAQLDVMIEAVRLNPGIRAPWLMTHPSRQGTPAR